jgi:antitoxin CptB
MGNSADEVRLRRVKFRAWHRGFREADLILGPFADQFLDGFTSDQMDAFETLIDEADQDLYGWIVGRIETPPEFDGEILNLIKDFRFKAHAVRGDGRGA